MTTSVLTTQRGYLTEYDLQVIRDFAIEAPWEWRMALEALVEDAAEHLEELDEHEKLMKDHDALQDSISSHVEYLKTRLEKLTSEMAAASSVGQMRAAFATFKGDVNDSISALKSEDAQSDPPSPGKG